MPEKAYAVLAKYYDYLMDQDYQAWCRYLQMLWGLSGRTPKSVLDLGCGTGNLSIPLAELGLQVIAVDRSPEMIAQARKKTGEGLDIQYICQDMSRIELSQCFDMIICACDSLNYVTEAATLEKTFARARAHLHEDGLFFFDLNSEMKLSAIYGEESYADLHGSFCYFWDNYYDTEKELCRMDLTFFICEEGELYRRSSERHWQKLWRPQVIEETLKRTGFSLDGFYEFLSVSAPADDTERWQFVASKK